MAVRERMCAAESASARRETWQKAFRISASANLAKAVAAISAVLMAWHAYSSWPEPRQFAARECGGNFPLVAVPLPFPNKGQIANFAVGAANRALTMEFKNRRGDQEKASIRVHRLDGWNVAHAANERNGSLDFVPERRLVSTSVASGAAILKVLTEGERRGGRPIGSFRVAPDAGEKVPELAAMTRTDGRTLKVFTCALDVAVAETVGASDVERPLLLRLVTIPISSFFFDFGDPLTCPRNDSRHPKRGHGHRRTFGRRKRSAPRKNWRNFRGSQKRLGRTRVEESKDRPESGPANDDVIRDSCLPGDPSMPSSSEKTDDAPIRGTAMTMTTGTEIGPAANAGANMRTARERSAGASKPKRASSSDPKSAAPKSKKPRTVAANGEGAKSRASRSSLPNAFDSKAMRPKPSAPKQVYADANHSRSSSSDCGAMTGRIQPAATKEENAMSMRSKPSASNEGNATMPRSAHAAPNVGNAVAKRPRSSSSNGGAMTEVSRPPASNESNEKATRSKLSASNGEEAKAMNPKPSAPKREFADANRSRSSSSDGGLMTGGAIPAATKGENAISMRSRPPASNDGNATTMRSAHAATNEGNADANPLRDSSSTGGLMTGRIHPAATNGENAMSLRSKPFASNEGNATIMRSAHAVPNEGGPDAKPPRDSSSNGGGMKERTRLPASIWDDSPTDPSRFAFSEDRQPARRRIYKSLERLIRLSAAQGPMDASFWYTYDPKAVGSASGDADGTHVEDSRTALATAHSPAGTGFGASEHGNGTRVAPDVARGRKPEFRHAGGEPRNEGRFAGENADRFDIRGDSESVIEEFGPSAPSSSPRCIAPGAHPAAPGSAATHWQVETSENGEARPNSAFRPRVPDAGPKSASNAAPESCSAPHRIVVEDRNMGSTVRTQVYEFDERDDSETICVQHDASSSMPLADGIGPGMPPEAPIPADSFGREAANGSRNVDSSAGYGTSFPDPESEADHEARLEGHSEPRSAADGRNDAEAVRERLDDFDVREASEILHEEPDSFPTAPLPNDMESGMSSAVRSNAELRGMEGPGGHDGEMPHAEPVARKLARHANENALARRESEGMPSPDGHGPYHDEYPSPAGMPDNRRARDEGVAVSGRNAAADDFHAMFHGDSRGRPTGNRTESQPDMRESANSPEIAVSEAHQGHAEPNRERARVAQKRMLFGRSDYRWSAFISAVVLAGALGYAMGGQFATRLVEEFAVYPDPPTTPTAGETGTFAAAENQKEDSPGTDTTLLSEVPGIVESYAAVGVETPVSGHDSAGRYGLSESSGLPESSVQPKTSNSLGITDPSAISGNVGQPDPDDPSGMNERSPGDVNTAGSEYRGKAADPLGNKPDPLAANAIPNRAEHSDDPVGAEHLPGETSGHVAPSRSSEFDTVASANGVPNGNFPGEAPRPNAADSLAPVRETSMEDLEGDMEQLEVQLAEAMERASLLVARVEANESSLLELSSLLATIPVIIQSIEETQVVLLDIADRVETNETAYGEDMAEFSRTLAGIDDSVNKLTANLAVVSRIALSALGEAGNGGIPGDAAFQSEPPSFPMPENGAIHLDANEHGNGYEIFDATPPIGSVSADVSIGDFLEGYGYVFGIRVGEDGEKLVITEHGSVVVPE